MMDRPNRTYNDMLAVRTKFNRILQEIISGKNNHFYLDVNDVVVHPLHFTYNNRINARGKTVFWCEIDKNLELFDYHKIELLPQTNTADNRPVQRVQPKIIYEGTNATNNHPTPFARQSATFHYADSRGTTNFRRRK